MPEPISHAARLLGDRIREARLKLSLSQEEIANLAIMNVSNYGKIERGLSNPTFHTVVRIAAVLGTDPGDLVAGILGRDLPPVPQSFTAADYVREKSARS